jgi:ABC-2 type transport system ATP-binding protein
MADVLSVAALSKRYGALVAVDGVSLSIGHGEIVGLLGPNGAGKTTIVNMVLGVVEPTSGSIHIDELDLARRRAGAIQRTNFAAVYAPLPGNLTVEQNLRVFQWLYEVPEGRKRIDEVVEQFGLSAFSHVKCGALSSGEQTRVGLAKAMLNRPQLLLLDEPTASLDPATAQWVRAKICEYARADRCGVLWTSHNMYEVADVCDRVLFLAHGRILLEGNPRTLPAEHGNTTLEELFIAVAHERLALDGG